MVELDEDPEETKDFAKFNDVLTANSEHTCLVLTSLPAPPQDPDQADSYLKTLNELTHDLPPTMMICSTQNVATRHHEAV